MFSSIVVGIDGSDTAREAVRQATLLAAHHAPRTVLGAHHPDELDLVAAVASTRPAP